MKPNQVKALDKLFSEVIRLRANGYCEKCGHWVKFEGINPSHYYSRSNKIIRWDEENVDGLCNDCHQYFHQFPSEYTIWKINELGLKRISLLRQRANYIIKLDYEATKTQLQNSIKELERVRK